MGFAPDYIACVLSENFEDAKRFFAGPLMEVHAAHLVMLAQCGIVTRDQAHRLGEALREIEGRDLRAVVYEGRCDDLFYYVNELLADLVGPDLAGRLHTARSRNDIDMTMYRMRQREWLLDGLTAVLDVRRVLLDIAARQGHLLLVAHTHGQPAQPTTVAHYLLGVVEQLERDTTRFLAAFETTNRCPLGACAITGTGFPIDRDLTSALLGFSGPTGNTYGSIATADYLLEGVNAVSIALVGLGRVIQEWFAWASVEFGWLRLGEGFVQASSIMPQKRNPVALEHARALASKAVGQAHAVTLVVHNTPFADIVDTEDDLQPLVFSVYHDGARALRLVAAAMASAEFRAATTEIEVPPHGVTSTELADTLVREHDLAFATAHGLAARLVAAQAEEPGGRPGALLAKISREMLGRPIEYSDERLAEILGAGHFVAVRQTPGGPAAPVTARAMAASGERLASDMAAAQSAREQLASARDRLRERSRAL